ncbi:hypothetical protein Ahy_A04g020247 [Arachis hypogaea]|uniref:Nucleoside diphosphate kinase-like domain-containing protein n=1 Tax=Arachis hypogaea TaxID=3818 RepID=A0A445DH72_ARAHY|nr:hypothetical protein Ahy_A04g020247 [Arachis hypogaea]
MKQVWKGEEVITYGRKLIGATDPQKSAPGTIRGDMVVNVGRISDTELPISLKSLFGEDRIVELSIGSGSGANKNKYDDVADFDDNIDF